MRPARFQNLLIDAINNDGQMEAAHTYADARITRSLYGIILTGPVKANVQIAARSALGDDHTQPEHIVTGEPHAPLTITIPTVLADVERYLAPLAVDIAPQEVASVSLYSVREKPQAVKYGFTVNFHDGSAIFVYINE